LTFHALFSTLWQFEGFAVNNKVSFLFFLFLCLAALAVLPVTAFSDQYGKDVSVRLCFTPGGDCTEKIVREIASARSEILIQAYSFTSAPIAKALIEAHKRGIKVAAILDKSQRTAKYTSAAFLANMRIPTYIDGKHAIAHNKIMIIDAARVITGSFNFTKAAEEKNAENLLIIESKEIAKAYRKNWFEHLEHSEKYEPRY